LHLARIYACYFSILQKNCKISLHLEKTKNPPEGAGLGATLVVWHVVVGYAWAILCFVMDKGLYKPIDGLCPEKISWL